jgi:hypothetical protein
MTCTLFLGFVAMMATVVVALIARYLNRRAAFRVLAGLSVWFSHLAAGGGVLVGFPSADDRPASPGVGLRR